MSVINPELAGESKDAATCPGAVLPSCHLHPSPYNRTPNTLPGIKKHPQPETDTDKNCVLRPRRGPPEGLRDPSYLSSPRKCPLKTLEKRRPQRLMPTVWIEFNPAFPHGLWFFFDHKDAMSVSASTPPHWRYNSPGRPRAPRCIIRNTGSRLSPLDLTFTHHP